MTPTQEKSWGKPAIAGIFSIWSHYMPILSSVKQFNEKNPAFKIGGLRSLIFNENQNGLSKSGAIVRIGRKVLIDEGRFFEWVQLQNQKGDK